MWKNNTRLPSLKKWCSGDKKGVIFPTSCSQDTNLTSTLNTQECNPSHKPLSQRLGQIKDLWPAPQPDSVFELVSSLPPQCYGHLKTSPTELAIRSSVKLCTKITYTSIDRFSYDAAYPPAFLILVDKGLHTCISKCQATISVAVLWQWFSQAGNTKTV